MALTRAAKDALGLRVKFVGLGLVDSGNVCLLTSPVQTGEPLATSRQSGDDVRPLYRDRDDDRRFLRQVAGSRLLIDAAVSQEYTTLIVADVNDLASDGKHLIDVDDRREKLAVARSLEQFYSSKG